MAQTIYEVVLPLAEQGLTWVNKMVDLGVLTNAIIAPLTTVAGLRAVSSAGVFETDLRLYEEYQRSIDRSEAVGILTNANVAAANTVAGLQLLFTTQDANIAAANQQHSMVA
mgnify:FL=1